VVIAGLGRLMHKPARGIGPLAWKEAAVRIAGFEFAALSMGLVVFGSAPCHGAEPTFDLHSPAVPQGMTVRDFSNVLLGPGDATFKVNDQVVHTTVTLNGTMLNAESYVSIGKGGLTDYLDRVLLNSMSSAFSVGDQAKVQISHDPLEGSTIRFTKKDAAWSRELLGHAPSSDEKKALDQLFDPQDDSILYPLERIPVGYTWTVTGDSLRSLLSGGPLHFEAGFAQLTFSGVTEQLGDSCAILDVSMHGRMRLDIEGMEGGAAFEGKGRILRSLRSSLERLSWFRGDCVMEGRWTHENGAMEMTIQGPMMM